jgi:hypothetical protein
VSAQWWSWLLMAVGVTGLFLAGRARPAVGWSIGLGAQLLWVAYALSTRQLGFLVSAGAYGAVYARNLATARARAARTDDDTARQ